VRLDRALLADTRAALRSPFILAFLALEVGAGALFVARRGEGTAQTVLLIWAGLLFAGFLAWWAGRHRLAQPQPDPTPGATGRSLFALLGVLGMLLVGFRISSTIGAVLVLGGIGGWTYVALRTGGFGGLRARLTRDPRPFIPLLLLLTLPRLLFGGPLAFVGVVLALPSGIGQQLLYLLGLFSPLEALRGRTDFAAVTAALLFGAVHIPFNLPALDGDILAAVANAVLYQSSVGLIACLAFVRHRAVVPLGVAHALAIG
jgi:hypothetical protein